MKKKFSYDIEKNEKIIKVLNHCLFIDGIFIFVSLGLTYLGYDLALKKFTEFNACVFFYEFISALCILAVNLFHSIMKKKAVKKGEINEN